ncbi:hypothetical protein BOTNAR_0243g00020 [Botryotinia narcissicola]|uniref:Uncharacterized protein n=1 Tax=Botryotinia narcissicola TaxID=278944 RepID=A0A4Z1I7W1_9HELO|nr:hypothetical protein BOTNAR_0243g00020 [Botryotinia narcissicola]
MSLPEKAIETLAGKVNQLRGLYGFETVKYFTSPPNEDVFIRLSVQESSDCGVTAHMGLKDGCFGLRGCPVFKNRIDLLGRRGSKADLYSQIIQWFQDNSARLPMSYKEEKLYITLKAKMQSSNSQDQQFAKEYEAFLNDKVKIRVHTASQDRVGVVVSETKSESSNSRIIPQLHTTDNNNGRGIKRDREEDADMAGGDVEVPRKLSKQGRKRAARRAKVIAVVADSQD